MSNGVHLSHSTGCPDSYARIVNVSSDIHRYGTIAFDDMNDKSSDKYE